MITIEETQKMLDELMDEMPKEITKELNGGVLLLSETKLNPVSKDGDLYIMGRYTKDRHLGRYISIYYGSFKKLYGHYNKKQYKGKLRATLKHEFVHHLESLAGEKDLEKKDFEYIKKYLSRKGKDKKK